MARGRRSDSRRLERARDSRCGYKQRATSGRRRGGSGDRSRSGRNGAPHFGNHDGRHQPADAGRRGQREERSASFRGAARGGRRAPGGGEGGRREEDARRRGGGGSRSRSARVSDESESSESGSDDDEIVHFSWKEGMVLNHRYQLTALLGDGTFGRVVLARDRHDGGREVAVKIIRDVKRYMENAKIEADILADIRKADPAGKSGCSIMYETFVHEQRFFCLVLEPLGTSLYDFLKANNFKGFWMQDIQSIAEQAMQALAFLHGPR
ncbi:unnamed protein product, partial [Prorocentrum cordatum]